MGCFYGFMKDFGVELRYWAGERFLGNFNTLWRFRTSLWGTTTERLFGVLRVYGSTVYLYCSVRWSFCFEKEELKVWWRFYGSSGTKEYLGKKALQDNDVEVRFGSRVSLVEFRTSVWSWGIERKRGNRPEGVSRKEGTCIRRKIIEPVCWNRRVIIGI